MYVKYTMGRGLKICKGMATCLSEHIDDNDKADMQSATVILGLMPTILSYVGPTVGEMALLSSRRPVLAMLLVLGAPAIFATRPFEFDNPRKSLKKDAGNFVFRKQSPFRETATVAAQYLLLSLAVTNCLLNSMQLGSSTILSWKCSGSYYSWGGISCLISALLSRSIVLKLVITPFFFCLHRSIQNTFIAIVNRQWLKRAPLLIYTCPDQSSYKAKGNTTKDILRGLSKMVLD